jgi:L-malate glycosyltransferase
VKILQLITQDQLRGAEMFASKLSEQLSSRGHAVTLVPLLASGPALEHPPGVDFTNLDGALGGRGISPSLLLRLVRLLRKNAPDVIQANGSATLKYSVTARSVSGLDAPIIYRNISMLSHWGKDPVRRRAVCGLLARVDKIASVSEASREDLLSACGLAEDRVVTVLGGVQVPAEIDREGARSRVADLTGDRADGPLLFHVGSHTPEKNHEGLLEIFRKVREAVPGARLVLLGEGPLTPRIEADVADMGLRDSVWLLGARADAPELLAAADLLLLPSDVEGIPGVVLEAGAVEVPAVAYDVGGVREMVHDKVSGALVPYGDVQGFVTATIALLSAEETRRSLGRQAREDVIEHHALERSTDAFEALYREVIAQRSRRNGPEASRRATEK